MLWANEVSLPEPLTLEFALGLASADHPELQIAAAELERARAEQWRVDAETGVNATLFARLRWVDPPSSRIIQESRDDHLVKLSLEKSLYDFGRSTAKENATLAARNQRTLIYRDTFTRHRIDIMAAFFDVLLADQSYVRDTEEMSMTFVNSDLARERNELGQLSDIELMETRSLFQASRLRQAQSEAAQRTTRARLADLLNRPGQLSEKLSIPQLSFAARKPPEDVNDWFTELEQGSPQLQALMAQQVSAKAQLNLAQADDNPLLSGQVEVSEYTRTFGGNDNWRVGVSLDVPLFNSGRSAALQARRRAELRKIEAGLERQRRVLRQQLLNIWTELQTLRVEKQRLAFDQDYRDLYLDLRRAQYELEVATDLGDAMVSMSALRYRVMRADFATALAWARIDALLGRSHGNTEKSNIERPMDASADERSSARNNRVN
ncbi:MAG: TolC family protein [Gammaproteobacteria bacterium]|nr:TolC family protein [Gammaproteobacteria bacterium]